MEQGLVHMAGEVRFRIQVPLNGPWQVFYYVVERYRAEVSVSPFSLVVFHLSPELI